MCVSAGTWQQSHSRYLLVLSSASGLSPATSQLAVGQLLHTSPRPELSRLHCPCCCALVGPRALQLAGHSLGASGEAAPWGAQHAVFAAGGCPGWGTQRGVG